jgi:hypothetical protein
LLQTKKQRAAEMSNNKYKGLASANNTDRVERFISTWIGTDAARSYRKLKIQSIKWFEDNVDVRYRPFAMQAGKIVLMIFLVCFAWKLIMEDGISYRRRRFIVVLGDGVTPEGGTPPHVAKRVEVGIEQWIKSNYLASIVTVQKGNIKQSNPRDKLGFPIADASVVAKSMSKLMPSHLIMEEVQSLDTIGNVREAPSHCLTTDR